LVDNISTVLPVNPASGNPMDAPFSIFDSSASTGWLLGTYLQDEWNPLSNGFPDQEFVSQHCPPGEQNKSRYETHAC
jgi:hypothetical protein